jgi:hypothetical protein
MQKSGHLHALNTSPPRQQPQYPPNRRLEEPGQWKTVPLVEEIQSLGRPSRSVVTTGSYCWAFGGMKYSISQWKSVERVSAYTVRRNIRHLDKTAKKREITVFKSRKCKNTHMATWRVDQFFRNQLLFEVITVPQPHTLDSNEH